MINEEIVTYLKGKEDFNDNNFIKEWSNFSSLIQADKDPGQYLPYLFIIYYFSPNETIQDATKKLIDVITPKEILEFQENFIKIVEEVDEDIGSLRVLFEAEDTDFSDYEDGGPALFEQGWLDYLDKDVDQGGKIYEKKVKKKFLKEISKIEDSYTWAASYFNALLLPIDLIDGSYSLLKIKLKETRYTNHYLMNILYSYVIDIFNISKKNSYFDCFADNHIFLNPILNIDGYCLEFKEHSEDQIFYMWAIVMIDLVAKTKTKKAITFYEKMLDEVYEWPQSFYVSIIQEIEAKLNEFDYSLTHELRLNSEWIENPSSNKKEELIKSFQINKKYDSNLFKNASAFLQSDKQVVMAAVKQDGGALEFASKKLKADKQVVMAAVKQNQWALKYASKGLKADKEVVMAAVKQHGWALTYASKELKANKEVVMAAVKKHRSSLKLASKELKANKEVAMEAVKHDPHALEYASKELKADKKLVIYAVKKDGSTLQYTSKELQADKEVVMAAVKQYGLALQYASKELQADKDIVIAAAIKSITALKYASIKMQKDSDVRDLSLK